MASTLLDPPILLGYDPGFKGGDRTTCSVQLSHAQLASVLKAQVPPGDEEGMQLLKRLDYTYKKIMMSDPKCIVQILVVP